MGLTNIVYRAILFVNTSKTAAYFNVCHSCRHARRIPILYRNIFTTSVALRFLDARDKDHHEKEKQLVVRQTEYFDEAAKKARDKRTFIEAVGKYLKHNTVYRRGHVEFIYAALGQIKEFNAHRDLETYKKILEIFPKGTMIAQNVWQVEFMHYPKQQQCCIDILDTMESHGVIPDDDMGYRLIEIFGKKAHAFRKYQRMMYWMPKFKYANPYYVPYDVPADRIELAKMALKRMAVDLENKISVFRTEDLESAVDETYIVSAQSPDQSKLIATHNPDKPVFVEGGFTTWLRSESLTYFVLRSECTERYRKLHVEKQKSNDEHWFEWFIFEEENPKVLAIPPTVHEQEDLTVLGMCITGSSSKDSLASWIKFLERQSPELSNIPVIFLLRSPEAELKVWQEEHQNSEIKS